ncbi:hypothetical protein EUGRSUZ_E00492, partial [Eucalyptus grandis]
TAPSPSPPGATARGSPAAAEASLLGVAAAAGCCCCCLALSLAGPASAAAETAALVGPSLQLAEPANALSLPTWVVHVSSVVEWITAMALVWQYGEVSGYESWKGLSWGMVSDFDTLCRTVFCGLSTERHSVNTNLDEFS